MSVCMAAFVCRALTVPEAATGFEAEQEEDISGMKLSWTAPVEANGVITHYELTYHSQGTDGPDRRETLVVRITWEQH